MVQEPMLVVTSGFAIMPGMCTEKLTVNADVAPVMADPNEMDRQMWLASIAKRDESALAALYDSTINRVYGVALRITGRADSAEEVAADVYMQVWREAGNYNASKAKTLTWLLMICRSRALDLLRRRDIAESHPDPETLNLDAHLGGNDPADLLVAIERESAVHQALEKLTPIQRQLLSLAFFKGLSHQEIANYASLPLGSVKSHLRKALLALQQTLSDPTYGGMHENE